VDFSQRPLKALPAAALHDELLTLRLTGCSLAALPLALASLPRLEQLYAGANRLEDAKVAFACSKLLHAGLAYNRLRALPCSAALAACQLASLDLSHNNLCGLERTARALAALPRLLSLDIAGNPLCLEPRYRQTVSDAMPQLRFHDGQARIAAVAESMISSLQSAQQ
jgi:Leucine-rich repeat (LRR) protein